MAATRTSPTCDICGAVITSGQEKHTLENGGRCCAACWRDFVDPSAQFATNPPDHRVIPLSADSTTDDSASSPKWPRLLANEPAAKRVFLAGVLAMLILLLSPLFNWINVASGGVTGISGDGKIVLGVTVVAGVLLFAGFHASKLFFPAVLVCHAWGIVTCLWMGSLVWRISSVLSQMGEVDDPLARGIGTLLATQLNPGLGLYLGLIGGLAVAVSFGYLAIRLRGADLGAARFVPMAVADSVAVGLVIFLVTVGFVTQMIGEDRQLSTSQETASREGSVGSEMSSWSSVIDEPPSTVNEDTERGGEDKAEQPEPQQEKPATVAKQEKPPPKTKQQEHTVRLGETTQVGNLVVLPISVTLRKVTGTKKDLFDEEQRVETKVPLLVLRCQLANVSEGQVFEPLDDERLRACHVEDNFGNVMTPFAQPMFSTEKYSFDGQERGELKPNESYETLIFSEAPKVENAESFIWTLYFCASNRDSFNMFSPPKDRAVFVKFTKEDIKRPVNSSW